MAKRIPECRLCGHAHWSYQPHKLIGGPEPSKDVRRLAAAPTSNGRASRAQVATVRDGRIFASRDFSDRDRALEAAGLL